MLFDKFITLKEDGKKKLASVCDLLMMYRRVFASDEDFNVPSGKVLQLHSPIADGEFYVDGEVYIL